MDLKQFCADKDDPRWFLHQPWSRGDFTYATNGHIIVRVPRLPDVPENVQAPNAQALMFKAAPAKDWMPVPAATMPPDGICDQCDGTGLDEDGEDCEWCEHTGKGKCFDGMDCGDSHFAQRYLAQIQGWEIAPNGLKSAWIRCGDALGLLMPRRKD